MKVTPIFNEKEDITGYMVDAGERVFTIDTRLNVIDSHKVQGYEREITIGSIYDKLV